MLDFPTPAGTRAQETTTLAGMVERVTFHSIESGFCVLRVKVGRRDLVTVVGHAASINAGEWIEAEGAWTQDRTHGLQFRASTLRSSVPGTEDGIERYLASGLIRGVGPVYARKLVRAFGPGVLDTIERAPHRLREVQGIGPARAARIADGWAEQRAVRTIMLFLHQHGVSTSRAVRIHRTYGADAIQRVTENPYCLARDIRGIGFRTADQIARSLGFAQDHPARVRAGIGFALASAMDEGHCGLPHVELVARACALLEAPGPLVEQALALELADGNVVADALDGAGGRGVFLAGLHRAERAIADRLRRLQEGALPWPGIDPKRATEAAEARTGVQLAQSQREALDLALRSKVLVITGGPGVGKTTLVNAVLLALQDAGLARVLLCAPTGRAAQRLAAATGQESRTIHRLLEADPATGGFRRTEANPLECDLLVVDEASMVDVPLMRALLRAVPNRAALLLVGDADQLPSVGPGQVLADLIASGAVPTVRLQEVFRQAARSRIVVNAHRVNRGELPDLTPVDGSDFYFVPAETPEDAVRRVVTVVRDRIPARFGLDPVRDVQVLAPMNRGPLGARALNAALQQALNPPGETGCIERFGTLFGPGDKVMQVTNSYQRGVFNGDLGIVRRVDAEGGELVADFDGREVSYALNELDELVLAYAATIHKSQGSEYPAVVIPLATTHYAMLARNLLYTAITRGKRLVVLVGQQRAIRIAVRAGVRRRWTRLGGIMGAPAVETRPTAIVATAGGRQRQTG